MSRRTFEQLRVPAALVLVLLAAFVLFPRGEEADPAAADLGSSPGPSIVVGQPEGEVVSEEDGAGPSATPVPTVTPVATATSAPTLEPTATPEPEPTPEPPPRTADGFSAEVLACRSISGSSCNDQLGNLPANADSFTALVRFTDAVAGDVMNAILDGPSGTIPGAGYSLQGSGDGYYYSIFQAGGLPAGDYTLTATRNGEQIAVTTFSKVGG